MTVEVKLFDNLETVAADAGGALDRARTPVLFDRLDWFRLTLAHCPPPGRPLILRAAKGERHAWLFLMVDRGTARALASWYTLDFAPVVQAEGDSADLLGSLIKSLARTRVHRIELAPMVRPSPLQDAFRAAGWLTRLDQTSVNWRVEVAGRSFAEYWRQRPGQLRATVRRKAGMAGLTFSILKDFEELAWRDYENVYAASWKPQEGSPAFLRALAEQEGRAGTLRLGLAYRHGRAVAAQLWLVENGIATIHKLAYDESARQYSPGTLLSAEMFRHVIDQDQPRWIDFGTGDDRYKADWMDEARPLYTLTAFNPRTAQGLAAGVRAALGSLVDRLRNR